MATAYEREWAEFYKKQAEEEAAKKKEGEKKASDSSTSHATKDADTVESTPEVVEHLEDFDASVRKASVAPSKGNKSDASESTSSRASVAVVESKSRESLVAPPGVKSMLNAEELSSAGTRKASVIPPVGVATERSRDTNDMPGIQPVRAHSTFIEPMSSIESLRGVPETRKASVAPSKGVLTERRVDEEKLRASSASRVREADSSRIDAEVTQEDEEICVNKTNDISALSTVESASRVVEENTRQGRHLRRDESKSTSAGASSPNGNATLLELMKLKERRESELNELKRQVISFESHETELKRDLENSREEISRLRKKVEDLEKGADDTKKTKSVAPNESEKSYEQNIDAEMRTLKTKIRSCRDVLHTSGDDAQDSSLAARWRESRGAVIARRERGREDTPADAPLEEADIGAVVLSREPSTVPRKGSVAEVSSLDPKRPREIEDAKTSPVDEFRFSSLRSENEAYPSLLTISPPPSSSEVSSKSRNVPISRMPRAKEDRATLLSYSFRENFKNTLAERFSIVFGDEIVSSSSSDIASVQNRVEWEKQMTRDALFRAADAAIPPKPRIIPSPSEKDAKVPPVSHAKTTFGRDSIPEKAEALAAMWMRHVASGAPDESFDDAKPWYIP